MRRGRPDPCYDSNGGRLNGLRGTSQPGTQHPRSAVECLNPSASNYPSKPGGIPFRTRLVSRRVLLGGIGSRGGTFANPEEARKPTTGMRLVDDCTSPTSPALTYPHSVLRILFFLPISLETVGDLPVITSNSDQFLATVVRSGSASFFNPAVKQSILPIFCPPLCVLSRCTHLRSMPSR